MTPLVGRSQDLDRLLEAVRRPEGTVLIEGEAGSGASRLVRELCARLRDGGPLVLRGACLPLRTPLPYGPVIEAIRPYAGRADGRRLGPLAEELRSWLPELALPPAQPPPAAPATARRPGEAHPAVAGAVAATGGRHRLFRAFGEVLSALGPAVLVIEDVHLADGETWDLVQYLSAQGPPGVTVVLTRHRPGGAAPAGYASLPLGCRIRLRQLTVPETGLLAAHILGVGEVPAAFTEALHTRTAGNPRWVEHLAHGVRAHRPADLTPSLLDDLPVPVPLLDTTAELLAACGRAAAAVVRAAAVLDEPATEQDLAQIAELPPRRVRAALVRALRLGALREVAPGRYTPPHSFAARAVRDGVPGPRRARLHVRTAELLASRGGYEPARLAHHYRHGADREAWVRLTLAAVDAEVGHGAADVAVDLLVRALADATLPAGALDLFAVRLSHAILAGITCEQTIGQLRAVLGDERLSVRARGEVRLNLGRWLINQAGELDAGRREIEAAVPDLRDQPELAARGMAALALPSFGTAPVAAHLQWLRRAERTLDDSTDTEALEAVHANRLSVRMQMADPRVWADVDELPRTLPSTAQRVRAYFNLADAATWNGHYDRARTFLAEGGRLAGGKETFLSMLGDGTSLRLQVATGRWDDLPREADRVIALAGEREFLAADAWLATGWLSLWQGARAAALHHFDAALRTAPYNVPVIASARAGRATVLLAQGRPAAACWETDRALVQLRDKDNWIWAAELLPVAVQALTRCGRSSDALALLATVEESLAGKDAPLATAALQSGRGALSQARAARSEAAAHHIQAASCYRRLPHPFAAAQAHEAAGCCLADAGDRAAAATQLDAAMALYTALGTGHDTARCRQRLRHLEGGHRRGRKGYGRQLSPREAEVATLAGQGLTNHQIAELLVLSIRTVEQHVARALRKLDLSSRVAFADHPLTPHDPSQTLTPHHPPQPPARREDAPHEDAPLEDAPREDAPREDAPPPIGRPTR
ncbi:AAA family ATPase [Streptomyces sp. NPDC046887]|uniref:ATP-binding protein n=1 Tax=Streptomyces sp. NPDC046887 TaxID=3155472 RepID=UPI0033F3C779